MNTLRLLSSLCLSLSIGLTLAACDGADQGEGENKLEGRACAVSGEATDCTTEGTASYCGYMELADAQSFSGELTQGPCIAADEIECEPGDRKHEGPTESEEGEICVGSDYNCQVIGGEPTWVYQECNTPLVLRFDQRPVQMIAHEATPAATFDINMRANSCVTTDWPTAVTPWLVVDLDGNGSIDGGNELFGSGSRLANGAHAEHGFAALVEFDSNADGSVDPSDARFGELMLWRDWNADRLSTPNELESLTSAGVERLAVDYRIETECDERGNCGVQRSAFEFAGGSVGEVVDIYLPCQ
jgi:hypothetical protein